MFARLDQIRRLIDGDSSSLEAWLSGSYTLSAIAEDVE